MGKLGRWLQVGANIGILSGLVLVGIQLKQTNDLQKIEHISRSYELDMAHVLSAAGEDPAAILAKAVFNPEQMTPRDRIAYSASLQYMRTLAHRSAWLEGEGLFDEDWRNVTLPRIAFMFGGNPVGRQMWESLKSQYSEFPEWLIELDKRIEQTPEDLHYQTWNSIGQLNANSEPTLRTPTDKSYASGCSTRCKARATDPPACRLDHHSQDSTSDCPLIILVSLSRGVCTQQNVSDAGDQNGRSWPILLTQLPSIRT